MSVARNMNINIRKPTIRLFALCAFYLIYLFIGAAIFSFIEYSNEQEIIENLKIKRAEFLLNNKACLNGNKFRPYHSFSISLIGLFVCTCRLGSRDVHWPHSGG